MCNFKTAVPSLAAPAGRSAIFHFIEDLKFHLQVFLTPSHLAIVMEYVEGGTLLDHVKRMGKIDEDEARSVGRRLPGTR